MASVFTAAMDFVARYRAETCSCVVRIYTKSGVTAHLAVSPCSLKGAAAQVYPWVVKFANLQARASGWQNGLQSSTFTFDVRDLEQAFTTLFGTDFRDDLVDLLLISDDLSITPADYAVMWTGRVVQAVPGGPVISFSCRSRDKELDVPIPRSSINDFSFRALPDGSADLNNAQQVVIGVHSAEGYAGDNGMVKAVLVDVDANRYLAAAGRILIDRVYSANVLQVIATDYAIVQRKSADLRLGTYIEFVATQGEKEVSFDARGFTDDGLVTGNMVNDGTGILALVMNLFAYNDWRSGAFPTTAPLASAFFSLTFDFLAALGHTASYWLSSRRDRGYSVVEQFAITFGLRAWWTLAGTLAVAPLDHRLQGDDVYHGPGSPDSAFDDDLVLDADLMKNAPVPTFDDQGLAQQARVRIGYSARTGQYQHERVVSIGQLGDERVIEGRFAPASPLSGDYVFDLKPDSDGTPLGYNVSPSSFWQRAQLEDGPDGVTVNGPNTAVTNNTSIDCDWAVSHETLPAMASISWVEIRARVKAAMVGGTSGNYYQLGVKIAGVVYPSSGSFSSANAQAVDLPLDWQWISYRMLNPPDAPTDPWTSTKVNAMFSYGRYHPAGDNGEVDQVLIRVHGFPASIAFSPLALDIGSRLVHRYEKQFEGLQCKDLPLRYAGLELLSFLSVVWRRRGWGDTYQTREPYAITGRDFNPNNLTVELKLEPLREFLTTFRLDAKASIDVLPDVIGQGVCLVTAGASLTASGGPTCVEHPAGEGLQAGPIVKTVANSFPFGRRGLACHGAREQVNPDPCFQRGLLGWTITAGSGGAAVTADGTLDYQLFADPTDTSFVLKFLAGTPHAAENKARGTTSASLASNTKLVAQIWRRDIDGAGPMAFRAQRGVDSFWWNESTGAFQSGSVDNVLPTTENWDMFVSRVINVGGSATTITMELVQPSSGTSGRVSLVGYAAFDKKAWAGPPIVGGATPGSILARSLSVQGDCPGGFKTWPPKRGKWRGRVRPWWNAADAANSDVFTVFYLFYDVDNLWSLAYSVHASGGGGVGWRFRARSSGVNVDIFVQGPAGVPTRYTEVEIEVAWTLEGIMTLRVTDATGSTSSSIAYTAPQEDSAFFYIGSAAGSQAFEGDVVTLRNSPFPNLG
jgi:hypothetical protein